MTPFYELTILQRSIFALWVYLLCFGAAYCTISALTIRQYRIAAATLPPFVLAVYLWQVTFELYQNDKAGIGLAMNLKLGAIPWGYWLGVLLLMTLILCALGSLGHRLSKEHITPRVLKQFVDKMPCGICFWNESGRVLLSNNCMNRLCLALTDSPLLNGNHFKAAVSREIMPLGDKVWRFTFREMQEEGGPLYEMIASDITNEYAKTATLEKDRAELARLNRELREYYLSVDDSVRRQEILQAKVNIHDEMNRLMLLTVSADLEKDSGEEIKQIFSLWQRSSLLLCMEAGDRGKAKSRLDSLAKALGMELIFRNDLTLELAAGQQELFFAAAQEAIANAVKHAHASALEIAFSRGENTVSCSFINACGAGAEEEVPFTGGLDNLRVLAGEQQATVSARRGENFVLTLTFPAESR